MDKELFEMSADLNEMHAATMKDIAAKHDWKTVAMWRHGKVSAIFRCREQLHISLAEAKAMVENFIENETCKNILASV